MEPAAIPASGRRSAGADARGTSPPRRGCEVGELFALLGQPRMLEVLQLLVASNGTPLRFTQLQDRLHLSPKTLASRLRALTGAGFVTRRAFNEIPPRVEYEVTRKAVELGELFELLGAWASRNTIVTVPQVAVVGPVRARAARAA